MRVLQVAHHFLPRHRAGVEVYTDRIARALLRLGAKTAVVATTDEPLARAGSVERVDQAGLPVWWIGHPRGVAHPEDTLGLPAVRQAFERVLDAFRPDVVHFQHLMYIGLDASAAVAERGLPAFLTLQEYWLLCARDGQMRRGGGERCVEAVRETCAECLSGFRFGRGPGELRAVRWAERVRRLTGWDPFPVLKRVRQAMDARKPRGDKPLRPGDQDRMLAFLERREAAVAALPPRFARILCPSMFILETFARAGWPRSRMVHAPYGIPIPERRSPAPRPAGPLRVGFLGSIVPVKGLQVLVRAHRAAPRRTLQLSIHGNPGADPAYWAAVRRDLVPAETLMAGPYMPDDVHRVLAGLDVVVVPSLWYENAPIVIAEARAAGVPVVASNLGGMAELVSAGRAGALFEPGNATALAELLTKLANDQETLARMAAEIIPPRSVEADARSLLDLYGSARELMETGR